MKMQEATGSLKETARLAGLFWLLGAVTAGFSLVYVRPRLIVFADAAATANNLLAHGTLFRAAIVSTIFSQVFLLLFAVAAFRLFKRVGHTLATVFLTSASASAVVGVANTLNNLAALIVVGKADDWRAFGPAQLNALMMIFLRINGFGVGITELLLGIYLLALGLLIVKSRFMPRVLGALLLIGGCGFPVNTATKIIIPQFHPAMFTALAMLGGAFVLPTILWLLIKGVNEADGARAISNVGAEAR